MDIDQSLLARAVSRARRPDDACARILVRLHRQVLGFLTMVLTNEDITSAAILDAVRSQLAAPLARHLAVDGVSLATAVRQNGGGREKCGYRVGAGPQEPISVVVCTRDRDESLAICLKLLQQLHCAAFEVVVVDNAPSTSATRDCFLRMVGDDARFRYVEEPVAGLSRARNRGLAEAGSRWVAFTDDDVQVDPWWLRGIATGRARDASVGCVTGLVPPAELDNAPQQYFDRRFSWGTRVEPQVYSLADRRGLSSLYPYSAGLFGTGANFAVDRQLMLDLGGFDEALGAGSPAGGGEELDVFVRVLRADRSLAYEPSAVAWHHHRSDPRALRQQLFHYGAGLTAFLTKYVIDSRTTAEILIRLPQGA
ncbi:MAG: glycosyltransferase, partial [Candidatus Dormibacteraeota bacterium]|nr:glycosyltransferase [Candidatus Dormibacteraeota bacterium]